MQLPERCRGAWGRGGGHGRLRVGALCALLGAVLGIIFVQTAAAEQSPVGMAMIRLAHRPAGEVFPAVQSALSPAGRASIDIVANTIIAFDTPGNLERVREIAAGLDRPTPQVTIRLRYGGVRSSERRLSTTGSVDGAPGLRLSAGNRLRDRELMLRVSSGSAGYLRLGREIPFTTNWLELCGWFGYRFAWFTEYRTVETGMQVAPLVIGNRVDLVLSPKLRFAQGRTIEITEAATRVRIAPGGWVPVVLAGARMQQTYRAFLHGDGRSAGDAVELAVRVDVSPE